jgi:hypothetical protein
VIPSLPVGTVLSLIGGLALVAAFYMPWLGIQVGNQGALLSGDVLGRLLGGTSDLRQFIPGSSGNPLEAQALRALVFLFPACGVLAALLAILEGWAGRRRVLAVLLVLVGLVPLVGLLVGLTRLPPNASREFGLWLNGIGSATVVLGPIVNELLARHSRLTPP